MPVFTIDARCYSPNAPFGDREQSRMDRYKCLEAFVQVAETGSLSGAARNLSVAKSTISERLTQLEALIGSALVFRSTRKLTLTDVGRAAFAEFAEIVSRMREIDNLAASGKDGLRGSLRVASAVDVGTHELPVALSDYMAAHPEVGIDLSIGDHLVDPTDHGFDLTIHYRRLKHDKLKVEPLARVDCGVFAAPRYLAQHGRPGAPEDLSHHRCIGYLYQKAVHEWVPSQWDFEKGGRRTRVRVVLGSRSNSSTVLQRLVIGGQGLAVLPRMRASDALGKGQVEEVLQEWRITPLTLYATYPRTLLRSRGIIELVRFLKVSLAATCG